LYVDTHCHLDFNRFDSDRSEVLERARTAGLRRILNPGINLGSSRDAIGLAEANPEVYAAVGVHPNDWLSWDETTLEALRELAKYPKVIAIGEIGLDYYRDRASQYVQKMIFREQLELASEMELPVVIHSRNTSKKDERATADVLDIISGWHRDLYSSGSKLARRPGVLHSYGGSLEMALEAISLGFWIGVTGPVTFKKADDLREVIAGLPVENILIETDAPFLTPQPYRGKRNEPAHVRYVAGKIAELHNLSVEGLAEITKANAKRLFDW